MSNLIQNRITGRTHYPRPDLDIKQGDELIAVGTACGQQIPVEMAEHPYTSVQLRCPPCKSNRG